MRISDWSSDVCSSDLNAVTVTTPTPDPNPDCPECETPPLPPAPEADIVTVKVTSDAGLTEYTPGESVDYTITVTNNGPSDAQAEIGRASCRERVCQYV